MKSYEDDPAPHFMVEVVQEFIEALYWDLKYVLDQEGITMLQWAFMQRALFMRDGIPFSQILDVTGESKDNVRRAAASLKGSANVIVDPKDRRSRKLVLTKYGRRRANLVMMRFEREMLNLLGARDRDSNRAQQFRKLLWNASAYLAPSDIANKETIKRAEANLELIPDGSLRFDPEAESDSVWTAEDPPEDWIPW